MQDLAALAATDPTDDAEKVSAVHGHHQPERSLLTYYLFKSLLFGPGFPIAALYFYFRFKTLRYDFDDEGVSMHWGILFRREISLTYARIQDIHLISNALERWLGLARVQIQTASGSSVAEITIEGLSNFEAVRDFLYARMRRSKRSTGSRRSGASTHAGVQDTAPSPPTPTSVPAPSSMPAPTSIPADEPLRQVVSALQETTAELRALRQELARQQGAHQQGEAS